jgi:hypothetical protein
MTLSHTSHLGRKLAKSMACAVTDFSMIAEGDRILCAVSGGKDSYAMHTLLLDLAKRAPFGSTSSPSTSTRGTPVTRATS